MPSLPAPLKLTPFHTVFLGTAVPDALTVIAEQREREREREGEGEGGQTASILDVDQSSLDVNLRARSGSWMCSV